MVDTIKFSQMIDGGNIANNDKVPGLLGGENVLFNNPWTFLPSGTTAERPVPSSAVNYRLRFNTDDQLYEYYNPILAEWVQIQGSSFVAGPFITYTADASLPGAQNLGLLSNGILKQTVSSGTATLDIAVNGTDYYGPGFTGYFQSPAGIKDANGNVILQFISTPSAVNYIEFSNNSIGNSPIISANGSDANISLTFSTKNTGIFDFQSSALTNQVSFKTGTSLVHETIFNFPSTSKTITVTWQDLSGTVAYLSDIPSVVPSELTKIDDTNVTLTLGGSPSVALLAATSLQLGWTGQLSLSRGGTNANLTASNGGIFYSTATQAAILSGTATANQILLSGSSSAPSWSSATYPATTSINQILYSSSNNIIGGITASNNGVLISGTTGIPSFLANGTTGQVLAATTGSPPSWQDLSSLGVTSITATAPLTANGLSGSAQSGAVTIAANVSTTSTLGVASFDATHFSVNTGSVSANDFTINTSGPLSGGGSITLGGTLTLSISESSYVSSVTGTASQVLVNGTTGSAQAGDITLTLPQSIATTSNVQFGSVGINVAPLYPLHLKLPVFPVSGMNANAQSIIVLDSNSFCYASFLSPTGEKGFFFANVTGGSNDGTFFYDSTGNARGFNFKTSGSNALTLTNNQSVALSSYAMVSFPSTAGSFIMPGKFSVGSALTPAKLNITDAIQDSTNYGQTLQITRATTGAGQFAAFIRSTVNVISLGYTPGSGVFGFGGGVSIDANFTPNYFSIDITNSRIGFLTPTPTATFHTLLGSSTDTGAFFTNNDFVSGSVGSGCYFQTGATSGNTYTKLQAFTAGNSAGGDLILNSVAGSVAIGGITTEVSALLNLNSTTQGFLTTRLTTSQRDGISSTAEGLSIYNTNTKDIEFYNGSDWIGVSKSGVISLTGTASQVLVNGTTGSAQTGALTLTLPQSIATTSNVQFSNLGLGITAATSDVLDINSNGSFSGIGFHNNSTLKWTTRCIFSDDSFRIGDQSNYRVTILQGGNFGIGTTAPISVFHTVSGTDGAFFTNSDFASGSGFYIKTNASSGIAASILQSYTSGTPSTGNQLLINPNGGGVTIGAVTAITGVPLHVGSGSNGTFFTTTDFVNASTGSCLIVESGAATGNTYFSLRPRISGNTSNGNLILNRTGGSVAVGTTTVNAAALFTLSSTTQGFLPPVMTTAQRNAISSPPAALELFDSDLGQMMFYNGSVWVEEGNNGTATFTSLTLNGTGNTLLSVSGNQVTLDGFNNQYGININTILSPTSGTTGSCIGLSAIANVRAPTSQTISKAVAQSTRLDFNNNLGTITDSYGHIIEQPVSGGTVTKYTSLRVFGGSVASTNHTAVFDAGVGIGGDPDSSCLLDLTSTTQGFGTPVMTTAQKNAISSPKNGTVVTDSDLGKLCFFYGGWQTVTSV